MQVRKEEESKAEAAAKQQAADAELSTSYRGTIRYKHAQSMPRTSHTAFSAAPLLQCLHAGCLLQAAKCDYSSKYRILGCVTIQCMVQACWAF